MSNPNRLSRFFSFVLRHGASEAGVAIDQEGWVDTQQLIDAASRNGFTVDHTLLVQLVETSNKRRFTLSNDGKRIRAAQGHSTAKVDISFVPLEPPKELYHGTAKANLESILHRGLIPGRRHYVHLSPDQETARQVGRRHGDPIVLLVECGRMYQAGWAFHCSENGVWLTRIVAPDFIRAV